MTAAGGAAPRRRAAAAAGRVAAGIGVAAGRRVAAAGRVAAGIGLMATMAALLVGAAPAAADEQPSILKAYGLDWIERVRDDAWPQPKTQRPIICLLDTGVAVTPDTPADDPTGPIVARLAIDGGDGLPQGNTFEHLHGTTMASVIAAPRNDYGTVGVFPQARIVSVRVTEGDATYITPTAMRVGADLCDQWALAAGVVAATVVMAESNYDQRATDTSAWESTAQRVRVASGIFVAAVGNAAGANLLAPNAAAGVLAVSAASDSGLLCSFAPDPEPTGLLGPGCSTEQATGAPTWPTGSSAATAAAGALLGAVAAMAPSTTPGDRMSELLAAAVTTAGRTRLDGTRIATERFAGLVTEPSHLASPSVSLPAAAPTSLGAAAASPGPTSAAAVVAPRQLLWRPTIHVVWRSGLLHVTRQDRNAQGRLVVVTNATRSPVVGATGGRRVAFRVRVRPRQVAVWIESDDRKAWRSLTRAVRVSSR